MCGVWKATSHCLDKTSSRASYTVVRRRISGAGVSPLRAVTILNLNGTTEHRALHGCFWVTISSRTSCRLDEGVSREFGVFLKCQCCRMWPRILNVSNTKFRRTRCCRSPFDRFAMTCVWIWLKLTSSGLQTDPLQYGSWRAVTLATFARRFSFPPVGSRPFSFLLSTGQNIHGFWASF